MDTAIATLPDASTVEKQAMTALEQARAMSIVDDAGFQEAGSFLRMLKGIQKAIDETFDGAIAAAHTAHKAVVAAKKTHSEPIAKAESLAKDKMALYQREAEIRAEKERLRLEAEARKKAEDEALAAALAAPDAAEADAILSEPITTAPVKAPTVAKANGVSFRDKHDGVVDSLLDLIKEVAAGRAPISLVMADMTAVRKYAEATKGAVSVKGIRWTKTQVTSVRS